MQEKTDNPIDKLFRDELGPRAMTPPSHLEEQVMARVAPQRPRPLSFWSWGRRAAVLLWLVSLGLGPVGPEPDRRWPEQGGGAPTPPEATRPERAAAVRITGLTHRNLAPLPPAMKAPALETHAQAWLPVEGEPASPQPSASPVLPPKKQSVSALTVAVKMPARGYFAGERIDTGEGKPLARYARQQWDRLRQGEKPTLPEQWKEKPILAFNLPEW